MPDHQLPWVEAERLPFGTVQGLWAEAAVGCIGGTPKSGKTWLALEMAMAVASGTPCLGRFSVAKRGTVLLYAAELPDGRVLLELKTPWSDGTASLTFTPEELVERLASLVPQPRSH